MDYESWPTARVYHFLGCTVMAGDVNLLTLLRLTAGGLVPTPGNVASLTCWKGALMRHPETCWNKFKGIACAGTPLAVCTGQGLAWNRVALRSRTRQRGR
jgi:hypothetical protein